MVSVREFSRDNARTPMQWDATENAGFTTGTPWLRVNPNYTTINAGAELADPDSLFHFYQKLIALRKDPDYAGTLVYGGTEPFALEEKDLMAYLRRGERTVAVLANLSGEGREAALPGKVKRVLLDNMDSCAVDGGRLSLKGWQAVAVELEKP